MRLAEGLGKSGTLEEDNGDGKERRERRSKPLESGSWVVHACNPRAWMGALGARV